MKVPFFMPSLPLEELNPLLDEVRHWAQSNGQDQAAPLRTFEAAFAALVGVPYALGVASGTDALFLTLKGLGVGPGHEVIACVLDQVATAGAIHTAGARVVFVDCNAQQVLDVDQVAAAIGPRTRAILVSHYAGQPADLLSLRCLAETHKLYLLENVAGSLDASVAGHHCGSVGLAAGYCLGPQSNLNLWGDGGMITTHSEGLYRRLQLLHNHGHLDQETYALFSLQSRLDPLQALVGNHQLAKLRARTERRIAIAQRYDKAFTELAPKVRLPPRKTNERHVFQAYVVGVDQRKQLQETLEAAGIETRQPYARPLHLQPAAAPLGYQPGSFPMAERLAEELISLPCHPDLEENQVNHIINQVQNYYTR